MICANCTTPSAPMRKSEKPGIKLPFSKLTSSAVTHGRVRRRPAKLTDRLLPASHLRRLRHQHLKEAPPTVPAAAGETNPIRAQRRSVISAPPPSRMKKPSAEKDSDEYRQRRERNNLAVKKSRMRSKQKAADTQQRVNELKEENERLEAKIKLLSKELSVLKDLFLEHAHNLADGPPPGSPAHSAANGQ